MIAADGEHAGVPEAAALEHREVRRAAADVHQRDAELLLVGRQHRFAGGQLLEHGVDDLDAGAVDARDHVLHRRRAAGDDVDVHLEPAAGHADGHGDAVLVVDDEVLRQHVEDLAPARQRHGARGVDGALDVLARDLAVAAGDGDDAPAVERLDVRAGERQVHAVDLDAGRELGLVERALDGLGRRVDVVDDAAPDALRLGQPDADDVEAAVVHQLADDDRDLRGPDVEPDQIPFLPCHRQLAPVHVSSTCSPSRPRRAGTNTRSSNRRST